MSDIDEVKKRADIVEVVSEFVKLKKAGRNFKGLCPFHSEKTPSFIVSPERQIWHCFGCSTGGDVFRFLMEMERVEFGEALRILAKRVGVTLSSNFQAPSSNIKEKIYEINNLASEYYQFLLINHEVGKKALDYILGRGITKASLKTFGIGYAPNAWDGLYNFLVLKKKYAPSDLELAGLVLKRGEGGGRGYYDRFRGRLVFSLRDVRGNVIGFAGRVLDKEVKEARLRQDFGGQAKYINTAETPVYVKGDTLYGMDVTKEEIKKEGFCVIVEGEIDCIRSYQAGVRNIVAIKGSALTENQLRLLKRYTENITLSLDADLAGDAAARRGIEIADSLGFNIKVVELLGGKDPDEAVKLGVWKESVSKAVPIYDYFIDSSFRRNDASSVFGKKKIGEEVLPVLSRISNDIVRAHYVKKLAEKLGVSEEVIENGLSRLSKKESLGVVEKAEVEEVTKKMREELLEEHLLSLVLQSENPLEIVPKDEEVAKYFTVAGLGRIFGFLKEFLKSGGEKPFSIAEFVEHVPAEYASIIDRLYLFDLGNECQGGEAKQKEIAATIGSMEGLYLKRKMEEISKKISEGEEDREKSEVMKLNEEFGRISKRLSEISS